MPYRPKPEHRRNVKGVIYPLTAAIASIYGVRDDGAYSLGAFYTVHIDSKIWNSVGGLWYKPIKPEDIVNRKINKDVIELFKHSIDSGAEVELPSGKLVAWEPIPDEESSQLPNVLM